MAKHSFRGMRRALRPDALIITLVLVCVGLLTGKYAPSWGSVLPDAVHEALADTKADADFGAAASFDGESDEVVNHNLKLMPAADKCEPLTFLMFNAHNYFVREDDQRSRYKITIKKESEREAVADVIASAAPQIVGLVEMGGPRAVEDLQMRLRARGLDYPYSRVLTRGGEDRALAVLSQHPIVQDHSRANCALHGNKRQKMLRGILDVTVRVGGERYFRVVGAHLKSRVSDDPAAATARRALEARTLAMYLQQEMRKQPLMPFVVYGDWNDGPADDSLKILRHGMSADAALTRVKAADSAGLTWTIYYAAAEEYCVFDQIYVNSVLRSRRGRKLNSGVVDIPAAAQAADHRAVWCELR